MKKKAPGRCAAVLVCLVCFLPLSVTFGQENHPDPAHSWMYSGEHGPEHWGDLSSGFSACTIGKSQSPIDIRNPRTAQLPPIKFSYQASPLKIINNGHTIQVNYAPGSTITVAGEIYELKQFPSEGKINGQSYTNWSVPPRGSVQADSVTHAFRFQGPHMDAMVF